MPEVHVVQVTVYPKKETAGASHRKPGHEVLETESMVRSFFKRVGAPSPLVI